MNEAILRFVVAATLLLGAALPATMMLRRRHGALAAAFLLRTTVVAVMLAAAWCFLPVPRWNYSVIVLPARIDTVAPTAFPVSTPVTAGVSTTASVIAQPKPPVFRLDQILTGLFWLGVGGNLAYLLIGYASLLRLRKTSSLVEASRAEWQTLQETAIALNVAAPELRESRGITSPFLAALPRPVLFVPAPLSFTSAEQRVAFAHELSHLRRGDILWFGLARLQRALLWFHPLAHLLVREMEQTAEEICDVASLQQGIAAHDYADFLLRLSEQPTTTPALTLGIAPFRSSLGKRIANLLRAHYPNMPLSPGAQGMTVAIVILVLTASVSLIGRSRHVPHRVDGPTTRELAQFAEVQAFAKSLRQPITFKAQNEPTASVLKDIFKKYGLACRIDPRIQGMTSVDFKQAPLLDVIHLMGSTANPRFDAVSDGKIVRVITFPPTGYIAGRVLYSDGRPAANVYVTAQIQNQGDGTKESEMLSWGETQTDSNGLYDIPNLGPYRYNVAVSLSDPSKEDAMADANAPFVAAAREGVRVTTEKTVTLPAIHLTRGGIIQGTVLDEFARPVTGINVMSYGPSRPESSAMCLETKTDNFGKFRLRVAPGHSRIYNSWTGYSTDSQYVDVGEGETRDVTLTTERQP